MRARSLFLAFPLALVGCGGGSSGGGSNDCTTGVRYTPRADYAGTFQGTLTPTSGISRSESYSFTVASDGTVTGSVVDSASGTAAVTGTATDYSSGCDDNQVAIVLSFTPSGANPRTLTVFKRRNGSLPGSFTGVLRDSSGILNRGVLAVSAASG